MASFLRSKSRKDRGAPVLAIAAQKGGVGKTTTAVHLAWALAQQRHRRVLLVDLDAQGHVGAHLGRHARVETTRKLGQVLLDRRGDVCSVAVPLALPGAGGGRAPELFITCPDKELHQVEIQLNARMGKELVLDRALSHARERYDLILLDCPPNLGNLTVAALLAASAVLVPTDTSRLSIGGVTDILATLELLADTFQRAPELLGVLLTRVDRRSKAFNAEIREHLRAAAGTDLMALEIPAQSALGRAQVAGTTVFEQDPRGPAAEAYSALADRVLEQLTARGPWSSLRSA